MIVFCAFISKYFINYVVIEKLRPPLTYIPQLREVIIWGTANVHISSYVLLGGFLLGKLFFFFFKTGSHLVQADPKLLK